MIFIGLLLLTNSAFACPDVAGFYPRCHSLKGTLVEVYDMEVSQTHNEILMTATHPRTRERSTDKFQFSGNTWCESHEIKIWRDLGRTGNLLAIIKKEKNKLIIHKSGYISGNKFEDTLICE